MKPSTKSVGSLCQFKGPLIFPFHLLDHSVALELQGAAPVLEIMSFDAVWPGAPSVPNPEKATPEGVGTAATCLPWALMMLLARPEPGCGHGEAGSRALSALMLMFPR